MNAIEICDLTKQYKDITAVDRLNLSIRQGELFSLLGINGAGKTTTLQMLSCLLRPTAGTACLLRNDITRNPQAVKALIGVSPQETAVAPNLSVQENLELLCGIHGFSKERARERTEELLSVFSLEPMAKKAAGKLSGGWQRRLSIAMALVSRPKVLFLDEPTLGLDVIARNELWELIRSLKGSLTIILTTHYMEEAEALSDRIGIMKDGQLIALGTADQLKERAGTEKFEDAFVAIVKGEVK